MAGATGDHFCSEIHLKMDLSPNDIARRIEQLLLDFISPLFPSTNGESPGSLVWNYAWQPDLTLSSLSVKKPGKRVQVLFNHRNLRQTRINSGLTRCY